MQADQGNALAVFLIIGAIGLALALDVDVSSDDGIVLVHDMSLALPL
jgi:hypothetical protein